MILNDTVTMMNSDDYKERFKAEYYQVKIRYNKLAEMLNKYEDGMLDFKPTCPISLLYGQLSDMRHYITTLESRAIIEEINLEDTEIIKLIN
jgi:hypothetical protein